MAGELSVLGSSDRHRNVDETRLIEQLALNCWGRDIREGLADRAQQEAARALERLIGLGLNFERRDGSRCFDLAETWSLMRALGDRGLDDTYRRKNLADRARVSEFREAMARARAGAMRGEKMPQERFRCILRREYASAATSRRVLLVPKPDPMHQNVAVEILATSPGAKASLTNGRLELESPSDQEAWIELSCILEATCTSLGPSRAADAEERCPDPAALELDDQGLIRVTPAIASLAREVAGDEKDPLEVIKRCWIFGTQKLRMIPELHLDLLAPSDPLSSALESGWADTSLASALMVALLRARGIPARLVAGRFNYSTSSSRQVWFEAWLPAQGWVPFDTLSWDLRARDPFEESEWTWYFFGALDYRSVLERSPPSTALVGGYALSNLSQRADDISYFDLDARLLHRDRIVLQKGRSLSKL